MKRLFFISLLILTNQFASAQTPSFFLMNLAIEETSLLNQAQNGYSKDLLFKKLTNICNKVDGVIIDEFSDYYLVSDIYATQSQTSNAGFLPVGTYKMNLKLKLIYKSGGKTFKELNFSKDYVVNTESEAAKSLINDFSFSETDLNDFFKEGAKKMKEFYSSNCSSLIESAKKYQSIGEPEKAIAICLSIPSDLPCYSNISSLTKELYTSLSYKSDYATFLSAQDLVSKGEYQSAFSTLNEISIYSQFYGQAQVLGKQINDFIFSQKELQKKKELAESEQKLKETEVELQQKRNELQESINQNNVEIANQKNETDRQIALQQQESQKQMKAMELQSKERTEMIKTAGNLLGAYINRPQPPKNTNFYIIK
jgi:hypothetical protein